MLNDQEIMERVQSGQVELFDELVRRHQASMLRAAVSKLRDQAIAEEAVQDAFLAAFAHRNTFRSEFSFRGWQTISNCLLVMKSKSALNARLKVRRNLRKSRSN